jgi:hypothetical protein
MMQTRVCMAYLCSVHFSRQISYITLSKMSFRLKDTKKHIFIRKIRGKASRTKEEEMCEEVRDLFSNQDDNIRKGEINP